MLILICWQSPKVLPALLSVDVSCVRKKYISHGILRAWSRYGNFFFPTTRGFEGQKVKENMIKSGTIPNSQVIRMYIYIYIYICILYVKLSRVEVRQVGSIHLYLGIRWSGINHQVKWDSPTPLGIDDVSAGQLLLNSSTLHGRVMGTSVPAHLLRLQSIASAKLFQNHEHSQLLTGKSFTNEDFQ